MRGLPTLLALLAVSAAPAAAGTGPASVTYAFHQVGYPDGHNRATFATSGSGEVSLPDGAPIAGGRVTYAIRYPGRRPDRHYTATVRKGLFTDSGAGRARLILIAKLTRSDDADCPAGTRMVIDLRDGGRGRRDQLTISNREGCNIPPLTFTSAEGRKVSVAIATSA